MEMANERNEDDHKDRGWAWVVAVACLFGNFFIIGFVKSLGIFFVEFLDLFDASSTATSLIFGMQGIAFSITSLFVMTVALERFPCRTLVIIGGVGFSASLILTSQAKTLAETVIYIGVLTGISHAFMTGPYMVILGEYFKRRHAIANGISVCGGSLGQFVLPPLLRCTIDFYTFRGALIILGGLVLNCVVCGALMRPADANRRKVRKSNRGDHSNGTVGSPNVDERELMIKKPDVGKPYRHKIAQDGCSIAPIDSIHTAPKDVEGLSSLSDSTVDHQCCSEDQCLQLPVDDPPLHLSSGNIFTAPEIFSHSQILNSSCRGNNSRRTRSGCSAVLVCRCCKGLASYCSILKNRLFLLTLLSMILAYIGIVAQVVFIPPHAKDVGLGDNEIALLISIMGGCDLLGRIIIGMIVDHKILPCFRILTIGFLILGVTAILTFLAKSFWGFLAISVSYGIFGGFIYALMPVVVVDFFGLDMMPRALGVMFLFQGTTLCAFNPLLGWLRDVTGSYVLSFYVIGGVLVLSGVTLLFVPCFRKWMFVKRECVVIAEKEKKIVSDGCDETQQEI